MKYNLISNPIVNYKASKNLELKVMTYFLSLMPSDLSGYNVCAMANQVTKKENNKNKSDCSLVCVAHNNNGRFDVVKNASGKIISCTTMDTSEEAWIEGKDNEIFPSDSTWHENETVPDYQNIDHSRLVPLLVKTIQELEARIKTLEDA